MIGLITMEKMENRPLNSVGSSRIRGRWLVEKWNEAEEYTVGKKYDGLIFQKAYWDTMLREFKGKKVFDLCDPDWLDDRPVFEAIGMCDALVVASQKLKEYTEQFTDKPVYVIQDRLKLEAHKPRGIHTGRAKSIVWFGYSANAHYLNRTMPVLAEYGLELTVISNENFYVPGTVENVTVHNTRYNFNTVHEEIKKHDLALLPQPNDYRGSFKTNNKLQTCWALGVPIVQTPEDIERLITAEARNKQMKLDLELVRREYDIQLSIAEYKAVFESITK